jgi:hypothetical protein
MSSFVHWIGMKDRKFEALPMDRSNGFIEVLGNPVAQFQSLFAKRQIGVGVLPQSKQRHEFLLGLVSFAARQVIFSQGVVCGHPSLLRFPRERSIWLAHQFLVQGDCLVRGPRLLVSMR